MKTMILSAMLTFLVHIIIFQGAVSVDPEPAPPQGVLDLPWQAELCCDSPPAPPGEAGGSSGALSDSGHPHCHYTHSTSPLPPPPPRAERLVCLDVRCQIGGSWENVICNAKRPSSRSNTSTGSPLGISFQRFPSSGDRDGPGVISCVGRRSITCSIALNAVSSVAMVTVNISNTNVGPPVLLAVPPAARKPDPPVNLTHSQKNGEGDVVLSWRDPLSSAGGLQHEVRYSRGISDPSWQRVQVTGEATKVSLPDLRPKVQYSVQVRSQNPAPPQLWSDWSEPHHIYLSYVTYIPEKMVVRHGDEAIVRCVFNDHSVNSTAAVWYLNLNSRNPLPQSQYTAVSERVSQITVRPSEGRLYDILQCYERDKVPYAKVYIQGAVINISCETNGDLDAMTCRWNDSHLNKPNFFSRWADITCDVMEEEEEEEHRVGGAKKCQSRVEGGVMSCTLQPLRLTSCYKLWLEMEAKEGSVRSHPVYITPIENVKPQPPSGVKAVVLPSRVMRLAWTPPALPSYELQYQVRYSHTAGRARPAWQELGPLSLPSAEVPVSDVCGVYRVEVRCMHANGTGYWSDWTETFYSTALNGSAPKQGPDFWRDIREDPAQNKTHVTLLFKHLPKVESLYCVEGLVVQHQTSGGAVTTERIGLVASHTFEWREEVHTVTVKAENRLGSSSDNINMTLDRNSKHRSLCSFSVSLVNSSCVGLFWSLHPHTPVPLSLVVVWSSPRPQDRTSQATEGRSRWARVPFTDRAFYLHGDFYGSEEYEFTLYPVFADGEGEPWRTKATRGDPAAYMLLMIITFLSIVLFVTLVISQNHMRKLVWKDVPNPNKCSWAQELDFQKAETMEHLFKHPDGLPAWPLLLVSETISEAVIVEKTGPSTLDSAPALPLSPSFAPVAGQDKARDGRHRLPSPVLYVDSTGSGAGSESGSWILEDIQAPDLPRTAESSVQSSVTYATVLLSDEPHLLYKQGGGSSSSDEGNFSANNSDISGSFPGGLWDLGTSRARESDPRRSCSFNSVEEFSETWEQEDEALGGEREGMENDLYYLGMDCEEEGESEEEEEEEEEEGGREEDSEAMLLKEVAVGREAFHVESNPLLGRGDSSLDESREEGSVGVGGGIPLYLPQFRTAPNRPLIAEAQDSALQL